MLKICAHPGCPELVERGVSWCPVHAAMARYERQEKDREIKARSTWRWVYKTKRWRVLRRKVLAEQLVCAEEGCFESPTDVDHIVALQDGGAPFRSEQLGCTLQGASQRQDAGGGAGT